MFGAKIIGLCVLGEGSGLLKTSLPTVLQSLRTLVGPSRMKSTRSVSHEKRKTFTIWTECWTQNKLRLLVNILSAQMQNRLQKFNYTSELVSNGKQMCDVHCITDVILISCMYSILLSF